MICAVALAQRADLPIPPVWVGVAAALVLVATFWGLALLWRAPQLEGRRTGPGVSLHAGVQVAAGAAGIALFVLVVYAGLAGNPTVQGNLAPTFVYVVFWVGLLLASVVLGDVFALLSPWRAAARAARWAAARRGFSPGEPLAYPERLGRWPAAAGVLVFAWLQLIYDRGTDPRVLALLAVAYAAAMLIGMARYGIDAWSARADTFGVVFGLAATLSPVELRDGVVRLRRPLSGATGVLPLPGTAAVPCAVVGATAYEGLRTTALWTGD
ncbi:MAG: fenitrothion hydrolase, partial [Solirubrobacteraceae bacterium]